MKSLFDFTNIYSLEKTLRFELEPVGKTQEHIKSKGIIKCDTKLAESYKKMKQTIDKYHRDFIEISLEKAKLTGLEEFYRLYTADTETKKSNTYKKQFSAVKQSLRKEIVKCFKSGPQKKIYESLDKKKLIQEELEKWKNSKNEELYFDPDFKRFTTYFTNYNKNRMNMYKDDEKSSAIAYRLINENLPKFIDNMLIFKKIKNTPIYSRFPMIYEDFKEYLNISSLEELFHLEYFNNTLSQTMIQKYNSIMGGIKTEDRIIEGLNKYIHEYNQENKDKKIPKLKMLYKQILSEKDSFSYLPEQFESTQEMLNAVEDFFENKLCSYIDEYSGDEINIINSLKTVVSSLSEYELHKVYIRNDSSVNTISQRIFGDFSIIKAALEYYYENVVDPDFQESYERANKKKRSQMEKQKKDYISEPAYLPLGIIQEALDCYVDQLDKNVYEEVHRKYSGSCIAGYFSAFKVKDGADLISDIYTKYHEARDLLNISLPDGYRLTEEEKGILKAFLDSLLSLLHFVKPLYIEADSELTKDERFYSAFTPLFEQLRNITEIYDKTRNFLTKKPYSTEKVKLNFSNPTLLTGWDVNKEPDYGAVLFERDGLYYVGILNDRNLFKNIESRFELHSDEQGSYRKIIYKQIPDAAKYLSGKQILPQSPPREIIEILEKKQENSQSLTREEINGFIDYCRNDFLQNYSCLKDSNGRDYFAFNLKPADEYETLSHFFDDVEKQAYSISFLGISEKFVNEAVNEGKLYLFKIWNKDFSQYSKGKPNLHTLYWKALFSDGNLKNISYKLNGYAEIFHRYASIAKENMVIHKANQPIACKNPNLKQKTSVFGYDIVKDRRYTCDKYLFHVPLTLNFKAKKQANINESVLKYLKNNQNVNIIGIDRGERHLIYLSLIDRNGNVVKDENGYPLQYTLNDITGVYRDSSGTPVPIKTPYRELLDKREEKRKVAQKNWETIEKIKNLKEGYISQVIHLIAKLMVDYNAIIVMEDLNSGFKNNRVKIEKQVYQRFENQLISKLNYLVFKDLPENEPGGLYRALQLTNIPDKKTTRQNGFVFYVSPWNTSKIDPVTGFVDLLKPKYTRCTNISASREFFSKFDSIRFNNRKNYFEFEFDYSAFYEKVMEIRTKWTVCTYGNERFYYNRSLNGGRGGYEKWNVTEKLKNLFDSVSINYSSGENLIPQIINTDSAVFFTELIKNLKITLALRYSDGINRDFILSPVSMDGKFYYSEECEKTLPQDGDANGAFNIARKGLCLLNKIDCMEMDELKKPDLRISNEEWLSFVQSRLV